MGLHGAATALQGVFALQGVRQLYRNAEKASRLQRLSPGHWAQLSTVVATPAVL